MKNQEIIDSIHKTGKIASYVVVTIDPAIVDKYVNYENIGCYQKDGLYFFLVCLPIHIAPRIGYNTKNG